MASSFVSLIAAALLPIGASGPAVAARGDSLAPGPGAQATAVPDDLVIKLERTACFGECPVYTVTIDARGNVEYNGARFVRVEGRQTDRIPLARVTAILETADRIGFFGLRDQYRFVQNPNGSTTVVTDLPTAFVTITRDGRTKRVEDYFGAPEGLKQLERLIDDTARTKRWILLDAPTLEQLVRDGWSPAPEERADLLRRAIEDDDPAVVKGLIDLGADPNGTYFGTNTPPLMLVQSAAVTRVLIAAGANPNAVNDNGGTPLGWSVSLASEVGQLLLRAGARADGPSDRDGRTPLWRAACVGHADLVAFLLAAGADPAATASGKSALECARDARNAAARLKPSLLDEKPPYTRDFDRTIVLLEQALAKRQRK
jgi:hypothetical protein